MKSAERLIEQPLAEQHRFLEVHGLQEVPDVRTRLGGDDEIEPQRVGLGVRGRDDLDAVAVFQLGAQRHQLLVDLDRHAAVADIGVHRVGEVDRGGAARQRHDLALRREDVDLVREEVDLEMFEELDRVARLRLHLDQALQPLVGLFLQIGEAAVGALVEPVRGDAGLRDLVHFDGADLHFDRGAERPEQHGVQRLVAVGLGDRDIVLELARDRLVEAVQRPQRDVARMHVLDDDAEAEHVEHLRERQRLLAHLAVDRIKMLFAAVNLRLDVVFLEPPFDRLHHFAERLAAVAARRLDRLAEHPVAVGVEVLEGKVLEFLVDAVEPEPVGDRRVDIQRFARDALAPAVVDRIQRAHVVKPVGELDQDHAYVARHRQQHFAEILRLRLFLGFEFDLVELGNAVDQLGDQLAEIARDLGLGDRGVLHHVMQQRRGQCLRIEVPLREDVGDGERMRDVGVTGLAELSFVRRFAEVICRLDPRQILRLEVA